MFSFILQGAIEDSSTSTTGIIDVIGNIERTFSSRLSLDMSLAQIQAQINASLCVSPAREPSEQGTCT